MSQPRFNPENNEFECFCRFGEINSFETFQKFKSHCKTKGHQNWKAEKKENNDEIILPTCTNCFDPMKEPSKHKQQCQPLLTETLVDQFQKKIDSSLEKFETCASCKTLLFLTTLSSARKWKSQVYCGHCFHIHHSSTEHLNHVLVKTALLQLTDGNCDLCQKPILTTEASIYEHINLYQKTHDPTGCLRIGEDPKIVIQDCIRQGVRVVHLLCAQMKTLFEMETKQIQGKKNLRVVTSLASNEERVTKKAEFYQTQILPKIIQFIHDWTRTNKLVVNKTLKRKYYD